MAVRGVACGSVGAWKAEVHLETTVNKVRHGGYGMVGSGGA